MQLVNFRLMESILKNIRAIREAKGYSQDQIADKLQISQSQYARFERGATKTDLETLYSFSSIVGLNLIDLITYPKKYIDIDEISGTETVEATLQIRLAKDKKDQVLKLVFGENSLEILNK
jgi:transcriptional regulator with XRE-family HTH domain